MLHNTHQYTTGEIFIKLDWSEVAGFFGGSDSPEVADIAVAALLDPNLIPETGGRRLVELPLHLVGHSRGSSVMSEIARELGYGRVLFDVDPSNWMVLAYRIDDVKNRPLKIVAFQDIQKVDDIWTSGVIYAENYKTKNKTRFEFKNMDFDTPIDPSNLEQQNLKRAGR